LADVEDAFQAAAALATADFIVCAIPDYRRSPVAAITPKAFLERAAG
jgi:hypothetical protein